MSVAHRPPRCSETAAVRADPRAGSAAPVTRWLLVEQPGPWGRDALLGSRLDRAVASDLARQAAGAGVRVLLVRRHGRAGHTTHHRRHWALVDSRPGSEGIAWGRFEHDDELRGLTLSARVVPSAHAGPGDPARPVYLACAHGRHDTCCAVRGREVAAALDELAPGRVWECSHVGGCRFAANVVVLPSGLYYGGVSPDTAADLVAATERGEVVPDLLRGRSSSPVAVQAAEHHARAARPEVGPGVDALVPLGRSVGDDGSVTVDLQVRGSDEVLAVTVLQRPHAPAALLTCAAPRPATPMGWELVSVVARPSGSTPVPGARRTGQA